MTTVQRVSVAKLDATLPGSSFADWFKRQVGSQAGIVWQLSECGEPAGASNPTGHDLKACVEANALLPDERKVVVMIKVGTFKQGVIGNPEFYFAVIEEHGELFPIPQLHDLQRRLHPTTPSDSARRSGLPAVPMARPAHQLIVFNRQAPHSLLEFSGSYRPDGAALGDSPPPPPTLEELSKPAPVLRSISAPTLSSASIATRETLKVSESLWRNNAITKLEPIPPKALRRAKLKGRVRVQVVVSVEGRVIEATAVSGPEPLRPAAVAAAIEWVFVPATLNGIPVQIESSLTFVFTPPR